jgi:predicted dehydrogenase
MTAEGTVGVGVIGLGFMGRTHLAAYRRALEAGLPCRVVAVCDTSVGRIRGEKFDAIDLGEVRRHTDPAALLADPEVHVVSICTPTDTHVALAEAALSAGKHVLLEKPVALHSVDVARLQAAEERAGRWCMPAMCMRYWPGWRELREWVVDGRYGPVVRAEFRRVAPPPDWNDAFYLDTSRSGGAILDLHIHDVDFITWCFGRPVSVHSLGTAQKVTTRCTLPAGPREVVAEGGWIDEPGAAFRMSYVVEFTGAVVEYDSAREPVLTCTRRGRRDALPVAAETGWEAEVAHFVACLTTAAPRGLKPAAQGNVPRGLKHAAQGKAPRGLKHAARGKTEGSAPACTLEEAEFVLRVIEAEHRSLATGAPVAIRP